MYCSELTEDELLTAISRGDRVAFSAFYDRVSSRLFQLVKGQIIDSHLAEEVLQEVFLEIWCQAARFDSTRGSARAWVSTMARRRAIDRVRAAQSSRVRDHAVSLRDRVAPRDEVWEHVEVVADRGRVAAALGSITSLQRECVTLVYLDGYSQKETAGMLGIPVGTVRTRLRNGLMGLRTLLGAY